MVRREQDGAIVADANRFVKLIALRFERKNDRRRVATMLIQNVPAYDYRWGSPWFLESKWVLVEEKVRK